MIVVACVVTVDSLRVELNLKPQTKIETCLVRTVNAWSCFNVQWTVTVWLIQTCEQSKQMDQTTRVADFTQLTYLPIWLVTCPLHCPVYWYSHHASPVLCDLYNPVVHWRVEPLNRLTHWPIYSLSVNIRDLHVPVLRGMIGTLTQWPTSLNGLYERSVDYTSVELTFLRWFPRTWTAPLTTEVWCWDLQASTDEPDRV